MVRRDEQLHISVPKPFRCPISMDVMRSPVSLSTGVTYDRSSIQHWLDSGHDTCPATMQILHSKDFVPNLNLRRLINLWAQSHGPFSPASSPTLSDHQLRGLVQYLAAENEKFNQNLFDSLSKMVNFAKSKDDNRRFLANFNGFVSAVVGVLNREGVEIEVLELVIRLLDLISSQNGVVEQLQQLIIKANRNCLSSIQLVLQSGGLSSKIESARVLDSIAIDADSKRLIAEKDGLLTVLNRLMSSETDQTLHGVVFSCLVSMSVTRSTKSELVRFGLVQIITETLSNRDVSASLAEKALKLLSKIATCAEGRSEISEEARCVAAVTERLMKGSMAATEDGVAVLWSVCCMLGDKRARECVRRSNGVAKILLVMQSGYGEGHFMRRMCGDMIKVLSVGLGIGLSYDTMTKHIMPC
ncbi:PREDICTED: U-box domain-containing protein 28-like [Fragaria vesca subsp. vesca]|uniref:U-box domain-containing protein 28-like n=1 Tax=Fragaria vesca subsp. vesca TaxID=101020 RepID=UPI0002C33E28|nr:PREDICTED: U-box domain-containing protein 28-like [Fragaria vesca subsp. vesca]